MKSPAPNAIKSPKKRTALLRDALFVTMGMALAVSLSASAEWEVQDKDARATLKQIRDLHIVGENDTTNEIMKDPGELKMKGYKEEEITNLDKKKITASKFESKSRCEKGGSEAKRAHDDQYTICQEIVTTELAQYQYSLEMYERTKKRHEALAELEKERNALSGYDDFGKMQANTNKVLALQAQLQIDHMQDKTYMDAYAARIHYLKAAEAQLAHNVLNGSKNKSLRDQLVGGIVDVGAGVALKEALDAVQTDRVRNN